MTPEFLKALEHISIDPWLGIDPQELPLDPKLTAGARAIKYARADGATNYDEIGFRTFVASPWKGVRALQTMSHARRQRRRNERHHADPFFLEVLSQQDQLRHRPLDLPEGPFQNCAFNIASGVLTIQHRLSTDRTTEVPWSLSLWSPPPDLLKHAMDRDVPRIGAQQFTAHLPGTRWLPLERLIKAGRFLRMQEWADDLACDTTPEHYYCFISHRWLTPTHPDPEGLQARLAAWQLVGYLAEAVYVAHQRGLRRPRRVSPMFGQPIGPAGTELAESLLVNVLRVTLHDDDLAQAAVEVRALEPRLDDYGVGAAVQDDGLRTLADILSASPMLHKLVARIFVWYDYSCLPQPPRTDAEQDLFLAGLKALNACQFLSDTVALLDDAEDYLSRAWCTLEAMVADHIGTIIPLVGSQRTTVDSGSVEGYFHNLLVDRPYVVRRAILDTEVFRIQDMRQCMTRLGLAVTDPNDLPFIYETLSTVVESIKLRLDPSGLVTGVLPMPAMHGDPRTVVVRKGGHQEKQGIERVQASLDWTGCLKIDKTWHANDVGALSSFMRLSGVVAANQQAESQRRCHAAIVAGCEGEAVLMAGWLRDHRAELEQVLSVTIESITWLAIDIAPVGHFVDCRLRAMVIDTPMWVVIGTRLRLEHCEVTAKMTGALRHAQVAQFRVVVDESKDNVLAIRPKPSNGDGGGATDDTVEKRRVPARGFPIHPGGLFRAVLDDHLL